MIRTVLVSLRDVLRTIDFRVRRDPPPIRLGAYASTFVERADRQAGVLVLKLPNGRRDLLNVVSPSIWDLIVEPLLTSDDSQGRAELPHNFRSLLTRHDSNGDEIEGDMKRLKHYIHPVGRGRGGNGLYFLAPYPRAANTVDG